MYTYFLKKYDCAKLGKFLSKKCKVSFFAKYIISLLHTSEISSFSHLLWLYSRLVLDLVGNPY